MEMWAKFILRERKHNKSHVPLYLIHFNCNQKETHTYSRKVLRNEKRQNNGNTKYAVNWEMRKIFTYTAKYVHTFVFCRHLCCVRVCVCIYFSVPILSNFRCCCWFIQIFPIPRIEILWLLSQNTFASHIDFQSL